MKAKFFSIARFILILALLPVFVPSMAVVGSNGPLGDESARVYAAQVPFGGESVITTSADYAVSVYAADVDGDGDLDVLSAAYYDDEITWYKNDGGSPPTFTGHAIATNTDGAQSVFAADLDGDGDLDILSASARDDKIAWYENSGGDHPSFTPHVIATNVDGAKSVYATDLDGDGDLDVLSASYLDDKIAWYENDGGSPLAFTSHVITTNADDAKSVYAADLDGDGDTDVLSASWDDDKIAWYENRGGAPPTFTGHVITTNADDASSVYAADVDGDGDLDVLSSSWNDNKIAWYENSGGASPTFTSHVITTSADSAVSVYAVDLDDDGDLDVLSASWNDNNIAWYENDGGVSPTFTGHVISTNADYAVSVYAADVDGDGDTDVLSASANDDKVAWYPNETIHRSALYPAQAEVVIADTADIAKIVYAADLDGDGDPDVLSASQGDNTIAWYENNGGSFSLLTSYVITDDAAGAKSVYAADIDGDGDMDVLSASRYDDKVAWYENEGGTPPVFTSRVITTDADGCHAVYAADLDGDGDLDVLSASQDDDKIAWYENDGGSPSVFTPHVITTNADCALAVYAADLDGDGDLDVLFASYDDDKIAWYENEGGSPPVFTPHVITTSADGARLVYAADVDGDGDLDVLAASSLDDQIAWYENDGSSSPVFTGRVIATNADNAKAVYAADLDGDGDLDILSASSYDDKVAWYENDGGSSPAFIPHVITTSADGAHSVDVTDLDSDGDLDILFASQEDDKIGWYENRGGQFALATTDTAPSTIAAGQQGSVLRIVVSHCGRAGDTAVELATLELLFEEKAGDPLSTAEANALIENLHIYRDDGSGIFEPGVDVLVTTVGTLALAEGRQTLAFADGDPNVQIVFGTPVTYFVVIELSDHAASQVPHQFQVTHVTESTGALSPGSTAKDRDHDLFLMLEFVPSVTSSLCTAVEPSIPPRTPTVTPYPSAFIYLPVVLKNFVRYAPPCNVGNKYCEDYDTPQLAYGPVEPGVTYRAYPEDERDYYYFVVIEPASVIVRVTNYSAVGWLIVRKDDPDKTPIRWDKKDPGGDDTLEVILVGQELLPGNKYYIQVYTESNYNAHTLYSLTVSE
jgi:hypothetical protein